MEPLYAESVTEAFLVTFHFILPFAIGAIMYKTLPIYQAWLAKRELVPVVGLFGLSLFLLMIHRDWSLDAGAGLMMALALSIAPFSRMLTVAPVQFLGKISFGLYLVHLPIIIGLTHVLYGRLSPIGIITIAIFVSVLFATLFHYSVEDPSTRFGHNLYRRIIA